MNISKIPETDSKKLISLHHSIFPKREKNFARVSIYYNISSKYDIQIKYILSLVKQTLDIFNIVNYDLSKWFVEFHQRNCGFEKKPKRTFNWHIDDFATIGVKVYTIIFYLRKDESIKGGGIEYMMENTKINKPNLLNISKGDVICFNGNLKHRPEMCSGFGCRDSIVVFVKRT